MVTERDYPPNWVILPGASLTAELQVSGWPKPTITILGNKEGLLSLGNLLLWISLSQNESLSVTGLPFVQTKSTLCLMVVQWMEGDHEWGRLVRTDKDKQFQWLIEDELLEREAVETLRAAFQRGHVHGNVSPDSEYELFFATNE